MASFSFYDATVPVLRGAITSLTAILKDAESHAASTSTDLAALVSARLIDDMLPLAFQVHVATDAAQKLVARVNGTEPAALQNNLQSFADFHARIAETLAVIEAADPATFDARVNAVISYGKGGGRTADALVRDYVLVYTLPNIFFHVNTAYAILRSKGVPLGKALYLSGFEAQVAKGQQTA